MREFALAGHVTKILETLLGRKRRSGFSVRKWCVTRAVNWQGEVLDKADSTLMRSCTLHTPYEEESLHQGL